MNTCDDAVIAAIRDGVHQYSLICARTGITDRKVDRSIQRLRKAGRIELRRPAGWFLREDAERAQALADAAQAVVDAAVAVHVGCTVDLIANMDRLEAAVKALLALRGGP